MAGVITSTQSCVTNLDVLRNDDVTAASNRSRASDSDTEVRRNLISDDVTRDAVQSLKLMCNDTAAESNTATEASVTGTSQRQSEGHSEIEGQTATETRKSTVADDFQCKKCTLKFNTPFGLILHRNQSTCRDELKQCAHCQNMFQQQYLTEHVALCEMEFSQLPSPAGITLTYKCKICGFIGSKTIQHYDSHVRGQPYRCSACAKTFKKKATLKDHMKTGPCSNRKAVLEKVTDTVECEACDATFDTESAFHLHYQETHCVWIKQFIWCQKCSSWIKADRFNAHTKRQHEDSRELFMCDACGKAFNRKQKFLDHQVTHNEKAFACTQCKALFKSQSRLDSHVTRTHQAPSDNYKCPQCGKNFTCHTSLQTHIQGIHMRKKKYPCELCDRVMLCPRGLAFHMLSHTKETPFVCLICKQTFKSNAYLIRHRARYGENCQAHSRAK